MPLLNKFRRWWISRIVDIGVISQQRTTRRSILTPNNHRNIAHLENVNGPEDAAQREEEFWRTAEAGFLGALKVAETLLEGVPIPGLRGSIKIVISFFENVKTENANAEKLKCLHDHVETVCTVVLGPLSKCPIDDRNPIPDDYIEDANVLLSELEDHLKAWKIRDERGVASRFVTAKGDRDELQSLSAAIGQSVAAFQLKNAVQGRFSNTKQAQALLGTLHEQTVTRLVNGMGRARDAPFDADRHKVRGVRECLDKTRTAVLQKIKDWVADRKDESLSRVFWLNGMAGLGKSTIAYSISQWATDTKLLGGSYFFNRDDPELRNAALVIPTLSFQLANFDKSFRRSLSMILSQNPDAERKTLSVQFDLLIRRPLDDSKDIASDKIFLVVLDAIDECDSEERIQELLDVLINGTRSLQHRFLVFITGRPESKIWEFFQNQKDHESVALQDIDKSIVRLDIKAYLLDGFMHPPPSQAAMVSPDWPAEDDFAALFDDCGELFVYAATVLRFIFDDHIRNPRQQLSILLNNREHIGGPPYATLDNLYLGILRGTASSGAVDGVGDGTNMTRYILETVVLLRSPLMSRYFVQFLRVDGNDPCARLDQLRSVMVIPDYNSEVESPRFFHKSFPDLIADPRRCTDERFVVDKEDSESEGRMCSRCLDALIRYLSGANGTAFATHNLKASSPANDDLLRDLISQPFPPDFRYACTFWASHLLRARKDSQSLVVKKLGEFARKYLLDWLEAVSYLGLMADAERQIKEAYDWSIASRCSEGLSSLLYDAYRFISNNKLLISLDSLEVYRTAIALIPHDTSLYRTYYKTQLEAHSVQVLHGLPQKWSPLLPNLIHSKSPATFSRTGATCLRYSHDGLLLAVGARDGCMTILDAISGEVLHDFNAKADISDEDSTTDASSVIDIDNVSASSRNIQMSRTKSVGLRIRNQPSGGVRDQPEGLPLSHTKRSNCDFNQESRTPNSVPEKISGVGFSPMPEGVKAACFAPDNGSIAYASCDAPSILIADLGTKHIKSVPTRQKIVNGFSYGSRGSQTLLALAGNEGIEIWDIVTLQCDQTIIVSSASSSSMDEKAVAISCVEFLPGGKRIIAGCLDGTVRLWDAEFNVQLRSISHSSVVNLLSVFQDGGATMFALIDQNFAVHIVDFKLNGPITTAGAAYHHRSRVEMLKFLPQKRILVSADSKGLCMWNMSNNQLDTISSPVGDMHCMAFTSGRNDDLIQVASVDGKPYVHRWEIQLQSPSPNIPSFDCGGVLSSMTFSDDGSQLATGCIDGTINIWDALAGKHLQRLSGHMSRIVLLAYSLDGSMIASASSASDVRIWKTGTGVSFAELGHNLDLKSIDGGTSEGPRVNAELCFSNDPPRVYLRSLTESIFWNLESVQGEENPKVNGPHGEPINRKQGKGVRSDPSKRSLPEVRVINGLYALGELHASLLFAAFKREDKWEFIALPTREVDSLGPVAMRGPRMAISTPTECEKFILLDISKVESPTRTPVFLDDGRTFNFPGIKSVRSGLAGDEHEWEETIDSLRGLGSSTAFAHIGI